jgi:hypothetical protein
MGVSFGGHYIRQGGDDTKKARTDGRELPPFHLKLLY